MKRYNEIYGIIHGRIHFVREPTVHKMHSRQYRAKSSFSILGGDCINTFNLLLGERIKEINNYPGYFITDFGRVFSTHSKQIKELAKTADANGYVSVHIKNQNGKYKNVSLHRLVAIHFLPNPMSLPEVNHKDKNRKNCNINNLEWCTRKENLYDSYSTMSPVRNKNSCQLFKKDELIGCFENVREAARYASLHYGVSSASMEKYLSASDIKIISSTKRINVYNKHSEKTRNRNVIKVYESDVLIFQGKTFCEITNFLAKMNIKISPRSLNSLVLKDKAVFNNIQIKRE